MNQLKKYKFLHWVYNLIHYKSLSHNKAAYRKYNIHKPVIASLSSKDFPDKESRAWLDTGDSRKLAPARAEFAGFSPGVQQSLLAWSEKGYLIADGFFPSATADQIQQEANKLEAEGRLHPTHDNKLLFANRLSPKIRRITYDERLTRLLSFILDKEVVPFQTINFKHGSNQRAHSDSIHMTTYPLGYLTAAWIAFEDIHPDCGPLVYYPGSHRLPYVFSNDVGIPESALKNEGYAPYHEKYEPYIRKLIEKHGIAPHYFHARKGDVLIWHANLLHGGSLRRNIQLSRRALVCHFFVKGSFVYHDLAAASSKQQYLGTCLLRRWK
jgi:hypothetical protein